MYRAGVLYIRAIGPVLLRCRIMPTGYTCLVSCPGKVLDAAVSRGAVSLKTAPTVCTVLEHRPCNKKPGYMRHATKRSLTGPDATDISPAYRSISY